MLVLPGTSPNKTISVSNMVGDMTFPLPMATRTTLLDKGMLLICPITSVISSGFCCAVASGLKHAHPITKANNATSLKEMVGFCINFNKIIFEAPAADYPFHPDCAAAAGVPSLSHRLAFPWMQVQRSISHVGPLVNRYL